jgi:DNA-binding response OmpR family regulator
MRIAASRNARIRMTEIPKRLLLVEPDDLLRRSLADQLAGQGFAVSEAISAVAALALWAVPPADLVLVDGGLAETLCGNMRAAGFRGPILVLGGGTGVTPALLAAGASECLVKPFRLSFLTARLQFHLRQPPAETVLRIGGFQFHPSARLMVDGTGGQIRLTEKEVAILAYLHGAGTRVVPRDELLGEVWGYSAGITTHTVETHIYRLRRKLDTGGDAVVLTEPGGYRLAGLEI